MHYLSYLTHNRVRPIFIFLLSVLIFPFESVTQSTCTFSRSQFNNQANLNTFRDVFPDCTHITNDVVIVSSKYSDVSPLAGITQIDGNLVIVGTLEDDLNSLVDIETIGGYLQIGQNFSLTDASSPWALTSVGGRVWMDNNRNLTSLEHLSNLETVGGDFILSLHHSLADLMGLESLTEIAGRFNLAANNGMSTLDGAENLITAGAISIQGMQSLVDLTALENATALGGDPSLGFGVDIRNNPMISDCAVGYVCNAFINLASDDIAITNNLGSGQCNSNAEVSLICEDGDGDGYLPAEDCDDTNPAVNPGMTEVPYNGLDDDCDPTTPDDDLDGDGFGIANDCDDNDADVNPIADEVCDGVDNNCDGIIDSDTSNYCDVSSTSNGNEWISKVRLIGTVLNNPTGPDNGYGDYTDLSAEVELGAKEKIEVSPGFGGNDYKVYMQVWVDWNQDGDFDDANEEVVRYKSKKGKNKNFDIPADATAGCTTMRVSLNPDGYADDACEVFSEGEYEDYSLTIIDPSGNYVAEQPKTINSVLVDKLLESSKLYPNPAWNNITLSFAQQLEGDVQVTIANSIGQVVYNKDLNDYDQSEIQIGVDDYNAGLYYARVTLYQKTVLIKPFMVIK